MKLITSDKKEFNVPMEKIMASTQHPALSRTLQNMFNNEQNQLDNQIIPLDNISSDVLQIIIQYCYLLYNNPPKYIDCCDETVYDDIREHCQYHIEHHLCYTNNIDVSVFDECDFKTYQIRRTWKSKIDEYKHKCQQEFSIYEQSTWNALWEHLVIVHTTPYCCSNDYTLMEKQSMTPFNTVSLWTMKFLKPYIRELIKSPLKECFITKLYMASEFLELPDLTRDISIMISQHLEKIISFESDLSPIRQLFDQKNDLEQSRIDEFKMLQDYTM